MGRSYRTICPLIGVALIFSQSASAASTTVRLDAGKLFELAAAADRAGNVSASATIYKALEHDPDIDIRCEARFRHGRILEAQRRFQDAAVLFRAILDEKPDSQGVRLELAKTLAQMGLENAALRELRQAQAGGLPPDVARMVDQFAVALRAMRPFDGSIEVGFAPSTNVNRATTSSTLNSVLGPLDLSRAAQARSGVGLTVNGQVYGQVPVSSKLRLTARFSTQNQLYRSSAFNDTIVSVEFGPDISIGRSRLRVTSGPSYRRYGNDPYSTVINVSVLYSHPVGERSELDVQGTYSSIRYGQNYLQDGDIFSQTVSYEHALSARSGGQISLFGQRVTARDPGYATWAGGVGMLIWQEIGKVTAYGSFSLARLNSDARLFLYNDRRHEWLYRAGLGATFRQIRVSGFSPVIRLTYERNKSTVGIYDYHRLGAEFAVSRAF